MPTFNLSPILFPKPKKDNVYDMLTDLLDIREREIAIEQGGEIYNPSGYNELIKEYDTIANDMSLSDNQRRTAEKKANDMRIKQMKADLARKKETDVGDIKQEVQLDLRELEFRFPNDPIAYSTGAYSKYQDIVFGTSEKDSLGQLIADLEDKHTDTTSLKDYEVFCRGQLNKYADIIDADERGDMSRLSEYVVVYTPYAGKIKSMEIVSRSEASPQYSRPTNLTYSRDGEGNLITTSGEQGGMPIYFIRSNVNDGDTYSFGNSIFNYQGGKWNSDMPEMFDYSKVKHAPLHDMPSGSFCRDAKDKLYFVNQDRSLSKMRENAKEDFGYTEDKVYHLSPDEEINVLPGALDKWKSPLLERYNREAEVSDYNYFENVREEAGTTIRKKIPEFLEGIEAKAKQAPRGFWEATKQAWGKPREKTIQKKTPSWGMEETKPVDFFESGKKFIEKITK